LDGKQDKLEERLLTAPIIFFAVMATPEGLPGYCVGTVERFSEGVKQGSQAQLNCGFSASCFLLRKLCEFAL
jgi:hypothetical protein